jgi:hypothetical protein
MERKEKTRTIWPWGAVQSSHNKHFNDSGIALYRCSGGIVCQNKQCTFLDTTDNVANHSQFTDGNCNVCILIFL